ncbi:MAG: N-acetyltransferase [Myxococcales bacterium]|nr:MAG: N-acetyltransferase [Myxococcales bacterium]
MSSPLDRLDLPLTTERLLIRRATPEDAAVTFTWRGDPDVTVWLPSCPPTLADWQERFCSEESLDVTLLFGLPDGPIIGDLMLLVRDAWAQKEAGDAGVQAEALIGYSMHPSYAGQGYATEAVTALMELCFRGLGVHRVVAECFAENEPSWRLMERLGMRREGHAVKDSLHRTLGWMDNLTYAVLREEWAR